MKIHLIAAAYVKVKGYALVRVSEHVSDGIVRSVAIATYDDFFIAPMSKWNDHGISAVGGPCVPWL